MKDDGTGKLGHGWSFVWVSRQYYVATVVKRRPRHPLAKVIVIVVVVVGCWRVVLLLPPIEFLIRHFELLDVEIDGQTQIDRRDATWPKNERTGWTRRAAQYVQCIVLSVPPAQRLATT